MAGVSMAGFRDRGVAPVDLRVVPHPTVMPALEFGAGSPCVDDAVERLGRLTVTGSAPDCGVRRRRNRGRQDPCEVEGPLMAVEHRRARLYEFSGGLSKATTADGFVDVVEVGADGEAGASRTSEATSATRGAACGTTLG